MKRFKTFKLIGNSVSILTASGGIISAIVTGGVALVAISTCALLIKSYMDHQNLDLKIQNTQFAIQSYQHLLILIKNLLRSGDFEPSIHVTMKNSRYMSNPLTNSFKNMIKNLLLNDFYDFVEYQ